MSWLLSFVTAEIHPTGSQIQVTSLRAMSNLIERETICHMNVSFFVIYLLRHNNSKSVGLLGIGNTNILSFRESEQPLTFMRVDGL